MEREARAEADLAAAVSAADTHQWHRFSKGYLIPRAGHSAVFVGDSGPSQATGKYLIFGGHDLQTRQNVFTIVTVSVGIGDSGELRLQTDVIFESDTSVDGPSPRSDHCMCENGEGSVLVFGGFDGTRALGDVHEIRWSAGAMPEISCEVMLGVPGEEVASHGVPPPSQAGRGALVPALQRLQQAHRRPDERLVVLRPRGQVLAAAQGDGGRPHAQERPLGSGGAVELGAGLGSGGRPGSRSCPSTSSTHTSWLLHPFVRDHHRRMASRELMVCPPQETGCRGSGVGMRMLARQD